MNVVQGRSLARCVGSLTVAVWVTGLVACGGGESTKKKDERGAVRSYLTTLPAWEVYSPPLPDQVTPGTEGPATSQTVGGAEFSCVTTPYSVQKTPTELVMYNPGDILWPGALIQGKTYRDAATGSDLLPLVVAERVPVNVSIPAFAMADNFRQVVPNQANVGAAVGEIISVAEASSLAVSSTIFFGAETYHSKEQFALAINASGKYLNFEGAANFNYSSAANTTTVVVHYMEKMFDVVVEPPQTPDAFFSDAFTGAKLNEQVALGRIGPDNVPVYVSSVTYGRMMTFALTSTATESEIKAAINAAYKAGAGEIAVDANAGWSQLIQSSTVTVLSVGGPSTATAAVIKSGDWTSYFGVNAPLSTAAPLSYTFRSLADGSVARVSEVASFDRTVCEPVLAPGVLGTPQIVRVRVPTTGLSVLSGDLNGDGRLDLVWNSLAATNQVQVAFGKIDGTFDVTTAVAVATIPASPDGNWTAFKPVVADMNGDGKDDLVWNRITGSTSETYVGISDGIGGFTLQPVHTRTGAEWVASLELAAARVQFKAGAPTPRDLLWSRILDTPTGDDATQVIASVYGATGVSSDLAAQSVTRAGADWVMNPTFGTLLGDLDGDGADDLAWGSVGKVSVAINDRAGGFAPSAGFTAGFPCTPGVADYKILWGYGTCPAESGFRIADVDGNNRADVLRFDRGYLAGRVCHNDLWECSANDCDSGWAGCHWHDYYRAIVEVLLSDGAGGFTAAPYQNDWEGQWGVEPYLRDVTGDGRADLVWINTPTDVRVRQAVVSGGAFQSFSTAEVRHALPALDATAFPSGWDEFVRFIGDVNGDGRADVIFANGRTQSTVYVVIL